MGGKIHCSAHWTWVKIKKVQRASRGGGTNKGGEMKQFEEDVGKQGTGKETEEHGDHQFGQLTEILIDAGGYACMRIDVFERCAHTTPTALDSMTPRFKLAHGPASSVFVEAIRNDVWVGPYCTQPDFDDVQCVYHCPWMAILK